MTQFKCFPLVLLPPKSLRAEYPGWDAQKTQEGPPRTRGQWSAAKQHWIRHPESTDGIAGCSEVCATGSGERGERDANPDPACSLRGRRRSFHRHRRSAASSPGAEPLVQNQTRRPADSAPRHSAEQAEHVIAACTAASPARRGERKVPHLGDTLVREGTTWVVAGVTESVDQHRVITMALLPEVQK